MSDKEKAKEHYKRGYEFEMGRLQARKDFKDEMSAKGMEPIYPQIFDEFKQKKKK